MQQISGGADLEIAKLVETHGLADVKAAIKRVEVRSPKELTVVVNSGMHSIPVDVLRGEVFLFSDGQVDLTIENAEKSLDDLIKRAHAFLSQRNWNKVFLIPSGHPLLVVAATLVTFRATRVDPVVVAYLGSEGYIDFDSRVRERVFSKSKDSINGDT